MSISLCGYLGPYLICQTEKVPSSTTVRACSNADCKRHQAARCQTDKFCTTCGFSIIERDIIDYIDNVDANQIRMSFGEKLMNIPDAPGTLRHTWIANVRIPDVRKFPIQEDFEYIQTISVTPTLIDFEKDRFNSFFANELAVLRQAYGEKNVSVQWGLVHYFN